MCAVQSRTDINSWLSLTALAFNLKRIVTLQKQLSLSLSLSLCSIGYTCLIQIEGGFIILAIFPVQKWNDKVSNLEDTVCVLYSHIDWGRDKYILLSLTCSFLSLSMWTICILKRWKFHCLCLKILLRKYIFLTSWR